MRWLRGRCCWVLLAGLTLPLAAQEPLTRAYLRQSAFVIPFQVDPLIDSPTEVQLFVSEDGGRTWRLAARELPGVGRFSFKAPRDGMYWFTSRTIGRSGKPPEMSTLRPELLVHVDGRQPQLDLQVASSGPRQVRASWTVFDPLLDPQTFQLEYRTSPDAPWQPVSVDLPDSDAPTQTFAGQAEWTVPAVRAVVDVRAAVRDRARNLTAVNRRIALTPSVAQKPAATPASTAAGHMLAGPPSARSYPPQDMAAAGQIWRPDNLPPPPQNGPSLAQTPPPGPHSTSLASTTTARSAEIPPPPEPASAPDPEPLPPPRDSRFGTASVPHSTTQADPVSSPGTRATRPSSSAAARPPVQPTVSRSSTETGTVDGALPDGEVPLFTKSRRFQLEYDMEAVGAGHVKEVQLWITADGGRHWALWGKDPDRQSPLEVGVDRDGVYGFRMVIVGDNGLATPKPSPGDVADIWVAVDTAPPVVRLTGARYGRDHQSGHLLITWEAEDQYLPATPIDLAYSSSRQGPWHVIAAGIPNSGEYAWRPGAAMPREVFLKIVVKDEAGNTAEAEHPVPVDLSGLAPRARIRRIVPAR